MILLKLCRVIICSPGRWGKTANSRQCIVVPNYGIHCVRWIKCIFHLSRGSLGGTIVLDTVSPLPVSLAVSTLQQSVQILCKTTKIESGKSSTKWHKNYKSSNYDKLKKLQTFWKVESILHWTAHFKCSYKMSQS